MWRIEYTNIKNLFSHEETNFQFKPNEMTLLLGLNEDNKGANSNGSGKSALLEGVHLALTGSVSRKVDKEKFIRRNCDSCEVSVGLINITNKSTILVKRVFYRGSKSAIVKFYENGVEDKKFTKRSKDVNKYIFEVLGVSEEDFKNYFLVSQGNNFSFFSAGDAKQKEIIARFSNSVLVDKVIMKLEEEKVAIDKKLIQINAKKESIQEVASYLIEDIESEESNFNTNKKIEIESCEDAISALNIKMKKAKEEVAKLTREIKDVKINIGEAGNIDVELKDLRDQRQSKRQQISEIEDITSSTHTKIAKFKASIEGAISCPKCGEKFTLNSKMSIEEMKKAILTGQKLIEKNNSNIAELNKDLSTLSTKISEIAEKKEESEGKIKLLESKKELLEQIRENVSHYETKLNSKQKELENLKSQTLEDALSDSMQKLQGLTEQIDSFDLEIHNLQIELSEIELHLFHFGRQGFKTYLANKSIRLIQDMVNFYLKKFNTNLRIHISGFKVLKTGDIRDKIEIRIFEGSQDMGVFDQYSGGEKQRITICGIIALQKLINNSSENGGLDCLMIDEISNLDNAGQQEIIKILSQARMTSLLCLHHVEDFSYKNKIYIKKKEKKSFLFSKKSS